MKTYFDEIFKTIYPEMESIKPVNVKQNRETKYSIEQEIVGEDDRVVVYDTKLIPYRWICRLELYFSNNSKGIGTGLLISPNHVLTAGHNLFDPRSKKWIQKVKVIPGASGTSLPFGYEWGIKVDAHQNWYKNINNEYDYGIIKLGASLGYKSFQSINKEELGWWGIADHVGAQTYYSTVNRNLVLNKNANVCGYAFDSSNHQYIHGDKIIGVNPSSGFRLIYYLTDTCTGNSGSPVWIFDNVKNTRQLIAIHTGPCLLNPPYLDCAPTNNPPCKSYGKNVDSNNGKNVDSNRGVLLTSDVIEKITNWIRFL